MADIPKLLSKADFDRYAARWAYVATQNDPEALQACFTDQATGKRMTFVTYPAEQLGWLISTVGAHNIAARFLIVDPDETHKLPYFALALYAADETGEAVSGYYQSSPTPLFPAEVLTGPISTGSELGATQVPHYLVSQWLGYWTGAPTLLPAMFTTKFGTLQGYNFSIGDMMEPLFNSQPIKDGEDKREVYVHLCLHRYYVGTNPEAPTDTFGLVLRLHAEKTEPVTAAGTEGYAAPAAGGGSSEPFYDMSTPCPPNL